MRVAYIVGRYPAVSHTFVAREARALRRLGVDVRTFSVRRAHREQVLTADDREDYENTVAILPPRPGHLVASHLRALSARPLRYATTLLTALRMSAGGVRAGLWQLFYFVEAIMLWDHCRAVGARHVHAHLANVASDLAMLAAHFGTSSREPWTWSFTMHGPTEFFDVTTSRLPEKVRRADAVVCITDFTRSQLATLVDEPLWSKLHVVRVGIDLGPFPPADRSGRSGPPHVLMIGRLVPDKGQAVFIEALAELRRRGVEARATIVGDGPKRRDFEEHARRLGVGDAIEFTGALGQDEIPRLYAEADVFCMSSFAEGLPGVLMEALATELPVIATHVNGIPELVDDGVTGLLTRPSRVDELADALERLVGDPELRLRLGRAGRERVLEHHDVVRQATVLHELFERVTATPGTASGPPPGATEAEPPALVS